MPRQRSHAPLLALLLPALVLFLCCSVPGPAKNTPAPTARPSAGAAPKPDISGLLEKQVLLTNDAEFSGGRTLEGASGFLLRHDGAILGVTARHLLGEAGGVEPEIKIAELDKSLVRWKMAPRVTRDAAKETVELTARGLDFSRSTADLVILKVIAGGSGIEPLTPNFGLPEAGEPLFVIGCPYSETRCRQNSYRVKFVEYDAADAALVCEMETKVDLRGFSGAPLVGGKGEVLGVVVSGGDSGGKSYLLATHIKEIEKIRF